MATSTIELNGRLYDAVTGVLLNTTKSPKPQKVPASSPKQRTINDVVRSPKQATALHAAKSAHAHTLARKAVHAPQPVAVKVPAVTKKPKPNHALTTRHTAHVVAHQPQSAHTLMRAAVKKPKASSPKAFVRVQPRIESGVSLKHRYPLAVKPSRLIDNARQARAKRADQSHLVKHFQAGNHPPVKPHVAPLTVQPHPLPVPRALAAVRAAASKAPLTKHQRHFDEVLKGANSHKQVAPVRRRPLLQFSNRFVAITVAVVALVIIGGFVVTQSLPQIDMKLASIHAGFSATLPSYQPAGFALVDHIQAEQGKVALYYRSTSDGRQFTVDQQTTNWNDVTLHGFVASTGQSMQSWQDNGTTVYQYGNHLTWVSHGIWYQITDHADLSSTQLLNIASSM